MRKKAIDISVIVGLAIIIVLLTIRTVYKSPPYGIIPSRWNPMFDSTDYLILLIAGIVAGIILVEPYPILWGWIGSIALSLILSLIYTSLYNWFVLGWKDVLSQYPFGFENVLFVSFYNIFRITLIGDILVFVGLFVGGLTSDLTGIGKRILGSLEY